MSSAYIRAIRGPVLLIVLGFLILADHRSNLSFWCTWPILLVAAGVLVLAERSAIRENPWAAANSAATPPPPPPNTIPYRPFGQADPEPPLSPSSRESSPPEGGTQS